MQKWVYLLWGEEGRREGWRREEVHKFSFIQPLKPGSASLVQESFPNQV
jgi:hypothetical protein